MKKMIIGKKMKKIIFFSVLITVFISCERNESHCEKWKLEEWCEPKQPNVYCGSHTTNELTLCNDDLNSASVGNTVMWKETSDVKYYRKFLQKL